MFYPVILAGGSGERYWPLSRQHKPKQSDAASLYTTSGDDLLATIGLDDAVVVRAGDVTPVVRKDRSQDIKQVVQQLKASPELVRST